MLNAIRTASSKWLGRLVLMVIMGVLAISFAIFGIGDVFKGSVNRTVASVGSASISAEEFRQAFNIELRAIQRRTRRAVTTEEARAVGLDRQILERMLDEAALGQRARSLGLAVDQAVVTRSVVEAPDFKVNGVFDRERLAAALNEAGLSERAFLEKQAELVLRRQIYLGLAGGLPGSVALGQAVHQYRNEERNIEYVLVPIDKVAEPPAPDDAALRAFYEERRAEFRTVETRKVTTLQVSPADFAGDLAISEADLRAYYDRVAPSGRFGPPEKRKLERVLFDTEADAKAAAGKLAGGMTFEALLAERKLGETDVDFGTKAAGEIPDQGQREAIFTTPEGKVAGPLKDAFGFVLIRVKAIEPSRQQPFELMRALIETEARLDKVSRDPAIRSRIDKAVRVVEDQRIAGKSLAEAAAAAELKPQVISALDRQGKDGAGNAVIVPGGQETISAIFASDIGLDNEPLQTRDGGRIWFEVNAVEPARDKAFEEVAAEARARLIADQRSRALTQMVDGLIKRIEGGETLAAIAAELGRPVQPLTGIKRASRDAALGTAGTERAFAAPIGKVVSAQAPDGAGRLLILPGSASLLPYDPAADVQSGLMNELGLGMSADLMAQYTATLRKELGVSINQAVLAQALGQAN